MSTLVTGSTWSCKPFQQSNIINRLRAAAGGWVTTKELQEVMAAGSIDLPSASAVRVTISLLRKRGFPIVGYKSRGYRYASERWDPDFVQTPAQPKINKQRDYTLGLQSQLLSYLTKHTDKYITASELAKIALPQGVKNSSERIKLCIYRLREKGFQIENLWGIGYKLVVAKEEQN